MGFALNISKRNNLLSIPMNVSPIKRDMQNTRQLVRTVLQKNPTNTTISRDMSVPLVFRFKKSMGLLAPDNGKGHPIYTKVLCDEPQCIGKTCKTPCSYIAELSIEGNFSLGNPPNKQVYPVNATDIENKPKQQNLVKTNTKTTISSTDLQNITEDHMVPNTQANTYVSTPAKASVLDSITK